MTRAELISKILTDFGVTVFFGIPGIHNLPFYRAFHRDGHNLVTVRHEQSAAFMADGFARASGRIAGCLLIDGPGVLNAATAIAQARADSIPMVIVTPCGADAASGKLHEFTGQAIVSQEINRAHLRLDRTSSQEKICEFLDNSLCRTRPGPVHLEIPLNLLDTQITDEGDGYRTSSERECDDSTLSHAIEVIKHASHPVIVVGGGAVHAQEKLVPFAEMIDAPVVNTTNAKGILPDDHALKVGYSPSFPEIRSLLRTADVVIALGTELGETDFDFFLSNEDLSLQCLIRVDIHPSQLNVNATADIAIQGDTQRVLQEFINRDINRHSDGAARAQQTRENVRKNANLNEDMCAFLQVIQAQTDVLVGDSSQPNYYAQLMYEPRTVRGYFHSVTGFGTLGYGIPAAIGAKIARPHDRIACLVGDGGAAFTLSELQTASQMRLVIPFIVWNNYGYAEIDKAMRAETTERYYTSPTPPNFALLAEAFAMKYQQPRNLQEFELVLQTAYQDSSPTIIEIVEEDFVRYNRWKNWFLANE